MRHAQRMVLIPESEYLSLKHGRITRKKVEKRQTTSSKVDKEKPSASVNYYKSPRKKLDSLDNSLSQFFSPDHQQKVVAIEGALKRGGAAWNSNFELTAGQGQTIANSNIVDLLKYALTTVPANPGKPTGYSEFIKILSQTTLPVAVFSRKATRDAISRARDSSVWETY